jgi:hypothetical protein
MVEALGCEINEEQMYFVDENRQVGGMDWLVSRIYGSGLRKVYLETTGVFIVRIASVYRTITRIRS